MEYPNTSQSNQTEKSKPKSQTQISHLLLSLIQICDYVWNLLKGLIKLNYTTTPTNNHPKDPPRPQRYADETSQT